MANGPPPGWLKVVYFLANFGLFYLTGYNEANLRKRLTKDVESGIRGEDIIERSITRIPMYDTLNTIKIDTNEKTVAMIANEIKLL